MQIQNATINGKPWRVTIDSPAPALYRAVFEYNEEIVFIRETHEPITFEWLAWEFPNALSAAKGKLQRDLNDVDVLLKQVNTSAKIKPQAE